MLKYYWEFFIGVKLGLFSIRFDNVGIGINFLDSLIVIIYRG